MDTADRAKLIFMRNLICIFNLIQRQIFLMDASAILIQMGIASAVWINEAMISEHSDDFILCTFIALFLWLGCGRVPRIH